ncbi:LRR 8 domain containing protein [Asbolus verrucosus]|uniref:LRR 8 domain containing protein n=1 Tax=Asbolus verrucosus TaxID=1661398 RepID=A0A482VDA8_ASBVE|nr:LRR 8 domain containing protein [Asbolus verrucosus]
MKFFELAFVVAFVTKSGQCRDLWSADLPNVSSGVLEKGKPLRLEGNYSQVQISDINGTLYSDLLSQLHGVKELRIWRHHITEIEKGALCSSPSVKTIELDFYLDSEPITLSKDVFANCNNLEELILEFYGGLPKPVIIAPDAFENLPNLYLLAIQGHKITHLNERSLRKVNKQSLIHLTLSYCEIEEIDVNVFENFNNLEALYIINNRKLDHLPKNLFRNLSKLKILSLRGNNLQDLTWDEFEGLSSLKKLQISNNKISSFDADKIAAFLPHLESLNIENNPPKCKQKEAFVEELKRKLHHLVDVIYKFDPGFYDSCEQED